MMKIYDHMGNVTISRKYLKKLVSDEVSSCFGVAGLNKVGLSVKNGASGASLSVTLHIDAAGEVNIPAVFDAITHKVGYVLTQKTGVNVEKINVYIDEVN